MWGHVQEVNGGENVACQQNYEDTHRKWKARKQCAVLDQIQSTLQGSEKWRKGREWKKVKETKEQSLDKRIWTYTTRSTECGLPQDASWWRMSPWLSAYVLSDAVDDSRQASVQRETRRSGKDHTVSSLKVSRVLNVSRGMQFCGGYAQILVNACCPGWVRTDMAGSKAPKSPAEGAETPVFLALLPAGASAPHGKFVSDKAVQAWWRPRCLLVQRPCSEKGLQCFHKLWNPSPKRHFRVNMECQIIPRIKKRMILNNSCYIYDLIKTVLEAPIFVFANIS